MAYYVTRDADYMADTIWEAYERGIQPKATVLVTPLKKTQGLRQVNDVNPDLVWPNSSEDDGARTRNLRIDSPVL